MTLVGSDVLYCLEVTRGVFEVDGFEELKSESEMSQSSVVVLRNTWFIRVTVGSVPFCARALCLCHRLWRGNALEYSSFDPSQ